MDDIVPDLLESIQGDFRRSFDSNEKIGAIKDLIEKGSATYKEANIYAEETGKMLVDAFKKNLSSDILPDGKMYYNIADRILGPTMGNNHELIATTSANIQTALNEAAGIGIKGIKPKLNKDRIDGLVTKISAADNFDDVAWTLDEPIINYSQSIVDDTIKTNADFHAKSGLSPTITRKVTASCCDWCGEVAGTYDYADTPDDIYRRHQHCRCTVEYDPGNGKRQDVWTKKWSDAGESELIEERKLVGITKDVKDADLTKLSSSLGKDYGEFKGVLNNAPDEVKELYTKHTSSVSAFNLKSKGGVYKPDLKSVDFSYSDNIRYPDEIHKYSTLAHEFGHHVDAVGDFNVNFTEIDFLNSKVKATNKPDFVFFPKKNSSSDEFLAAIRADKENLRKTLDSSADAITDITSTNSSAGVQDALDGMFSTQGAKQGTKTKWGHGDVYYDRQYSIVNHKYFKSQDLTGELRAAYKELGMDVSNQTKAKKITRDYRTASEAWANVMSADTVGGAELEYAKKYLPNTYSAFKKIIGGA